MAALVSHRCSLDYPYVTYERLVADLFGEFVPAAALADL
jgi:hypothetical protein